MTDEQINAAIADACGIVGKDKYGPLYQTPDGWVVDCPQFATCLNAMHEAERGLPIKKLMKYVRHLEKLSSVWFCADAHQRAEAFLRTLGKWEEVQK
jgi:hypothetical protein